MKTNMWFLGKELMIETFETPRFYLRYGEIFDTPYFIGVYSDVRRFIVISRFNPSSGLPFDRDKERIIIYSSFSKLL
jgi:hypothetical protein